MSGCVISDENIPMGCKKKKSQQTFQYEPCHEKINCCWHATNHSGSAILKKNPLPELLTASGNLL